MSPLNTLVLGLTLATSSVTGNILHFTPATSTVTEHRHLANQEQRHLYEANCTQPAGEEINPFGPDSADLYEEDKLNANSKGSDATEFLSGLRDSSGTWYADALHNFMIYKCKEIDGNKITDSMLKLRCVDEADADKTWDDKCIVSSDYTCPAGKCETVANCWWEKAVEGESRGRRFTNEEFEDNEDWLMGANQDSYVVATAKYLIVGLVLALLNFFCWGCFTVFRCCCCCLANTCCCRCCSGKPRKDGYNLFFQVHIPIIFYLAFVVGIVACSALTYVGNEDVTIAIGDLFDHSKGGIKDTQAFVGAAATPMNNIGGLVSTASTDAQTILDGTGYVVDGMTDITDSLASFTTVYAAGIAKAGAGDEVDGMNSQIDEAVGPMVETISEMLDTLRTSLVEGEEKLQDAIDNGVDALTKLNTTLGNGYDTIGETEESVEMYTNIRRAGVLVIFGIALVCVAFGLIGIFTYFTPCEGDDIFIHLMQATWLFGSIVVTLAWILGGVTMFAAVLWNDVCHILDIVVVDFEPYVPPAASDGLNACFQNTPLLEAYNLTSKLDFQDAINEKLAVIADMDVNAQFGALETPLMDINIMLKQITPTLAGEVPNANKLTNNKNENSDAAAASLCPFDDVYVLEEYELPWDVQPGVSVAWNSESYDRSGSETAGQWAKRVYTKPTGICSVANSASDPLVCADGAGLSVFGSAECVSGSDCAKCDDVTDAIETVFTEFSEMIVMQRDMIQDLGINNTAIIIPTAAFQADGNAYTIYEFIQIYKNSLDGTKNDLLGVVDSAIGGILVEINDFYCNMNCGFVAAVYDEVHNDLCATLLGGVLQISVAVWLLAIFMFFNATLGALLVVRMRGVSTEVAEENASKDSTTDAKDVDLDLYG